MGIDCASVSAFPSQAIIKHLRHPLTSTDGLFGANLLRSGFHEKTLTRWLSEPDCLGHRLFCHQHQVSMSRIPGILSRHISLLNLVLVIQKILIDFDFKKNTSF